MRIEQITDNGKTYVNVFVDKTTNNGVLRFGHEISVSFLKEKRQSDI